MAANARSSGSKIVAAAVAGTVGVLGVSTFYLPYVADRDEVRGLHENSTMPKHVIDHMLDEEVKKMQKEGLLVPDKAEIPGKEEPKKAGSMWGIFKR